MATTPEYKAVRGKYCALVRNIEQVLPKLTAKLFEKEMISDTEMSMDKTLPLYERSTTLQNIILKKIELDTKWYHVLISIFNDFPELKDIREMLEEAFVQLSDNSSEHEETTKGSYSPHNTKSHIRSPIPEVTLRSFKQEPHIQEQSHMQEHFTSNTEPLSIPVEVTNESCKPIQAASQSIPQSSDQGYFLYSANIQELVEIFKKLQEVLLSKSHEEIIKKAEIEKEQVKADIEKLQKNLDELKFMVEKDRTQMKPEAQLELEKQVEEQKQDKIKLELAFAAKEKESNNEIEKLEKNIEELKHKEKEKDARLESEKVKTELSKVELRKEKEVKEYKLKLKDKELAQAKKIEQMDLELKQPVCVIQ